MPNFLPYLLLVAISMIAFVILLFRQRTVRPLILLLAFSGFIYLFEFFIFVWSDSYSYSPGLVKIPYYDSVLGAVVSNLLSVPIAATFIAVYRLNWRWMACLAFAYGGVEWTFLQLGVYEHHWWRTAYTIIAMLVFFLFARQWPIWLSGRSRTIPFVTLVMLAWSVVGTLVFFMALAGMRMFHIGVFEDPYHDDIFFSSIYGVFKAIVFAAGVTATRRPWKRAATLLVIFAAHISLLQIGILKILVPQWQYWLLYGPCCCTVLWLVSASSRKLERFRAETRI
ncbi:hypothetical protein [Paenibacillus soyae]|uniref:Uncharacterized protein n=1 Tax=Paenibacillus soyae TaxID=2969249 RepID=A0A9X2MT82_9BACL|nr:hypothetical protein [Paenibacillus soyae]MCR2805829.1 hypothetical protein [Paenibacillus soyae]